MKLYEDANLCLDEDGLTVKNYFGPGHRRAIAYREIVDHEVIELGPLTGRHRLVGLGLRRPRHFFHWDRSRSSKAHAIALDVGGTIRPVITPDDHRKVLDVLESQASDALN